MRGKRDEGPVQILRRPHETDLAVQTHQSVEFPAQVEVHHVTEVKLDVRQLESGMSQHLWTEVQPDHAVSVLPVRDVPPSAAGNVKQIVATADLVRFDKRRGTCGFTYNSS